MIIAIGVPVCWIHRYKDTIFSKKEDRFFTTFSQEFACSAHAPLFVKVQIIGAVLEKVMVEGLADTEQQVHAEIGRTERLVDILRRAVYLSGQPYRRPALLLEFRLEQFAEMKI